MKIVGFFGVMSCFTVLLGMALGEAVAEEKEAVKLDPELEQILAEEKANRRDCKIKICDILRNKSPEGDDIACSVTKTWPKPDLDKIMSKGRVSWPWGHTRCEADINVKRATLIAAMSEKNYEANFDEHKVDCEIERKKEGETYALKISVKPTVTFEDGKAKKVVLNWGDLEAPTIAKGVIWPATGLDNKLNIFGGEVVDMINSFATTKCDEVKENLSSTQ